MKIFFFGYTSFIGTDVLSRMGSFKDIELFSRKKNNRLNSQRYNLNSPKSFDYLKKKISQKDYIFFFSSYVPQKERIASWESVKKPNIYGLINLLSSIDKKLFKKIIFSSSCSVYGYNKRKVNERSFLKPESNYGISKIVQENLIRIFCNSKNRKYFSLRLGYVFGKRMKNFRIIKKIFFDKQSNRNTIKLYNKKKNLNLIHVSDVSKVILKNFRKLDGLYNLTSEHEVSIQDFYNLVNDRELFLKKKKNYFSTKKLFTRINIKLMSLKDSIKNF